MRSNRAAGGGGAFSLSSIQHEAFHLPVPAAYIFKLISLLLFFPLPSWLSSIHQRLLYNHFLFFVASKAIVPPIISAIFSPLIFRDV
jgi:hypothetical protein